MRILGVGIATLDLIAQVDAYPVEDAEVRALDLRRVRGGNATNTLVALSQLGHGCAWAGTLADEPDQRHILDDLARHSIGTTTVKHFPACKTPTSLVLLSKDNGSRTIVHYRDLPEYPAEAFAQLDLTTYDWIHFEGRNVDQLAIMLRMFKASGGSGCSLEIEKPRPGIEQLFDLADTLLFSRHYARNRGFASGPDFLHDVAAEYPETSLFCAWGDQGGWALAEGRLHQGPVYKPERLVDTLGAGDVFNAGVIHGLVTGQGVTQALALACRLAGKKCGQWGFDGLVDGHES